MRVVIDRFEGEFAVCETESREMLNIEKSKLPQNVHEGDVLVVARNGITRDIRETERRKREIEGLMKDLWK